MSDTGRPTFKVTCRGADTLPIDRILEFQGKLKRLSQTNKDRLKRSILRHGFTAPLFVWDDQGEWRLLDGHQRLATLLDMRKDGYDIPMLPVDYIEATDEKEAREKLLNITSQYGEFDMDELNEWVAECDEELQQSLRLVDEELELSINSTEEVETVGDDEVNDDVEPVTKLGDLWELGEHRLLCGDSTKAEDINKLTEGNRPHLVFTDPPYNVAFNGRSGKFDVIMNDELSDSDFNNFIFEWLERLEESKIQTHYICCNWAFYGIMSERIKPKSCIVWAKNVFGLGKGYRHQHEFIMFNGMIDPEIKNESDLWNIAKATNYVHPTQKPTELSERAMKNSSSIGDVVIDYFSGSGSTLIGCEKMSRVFNGMELDPHYCDVIVNRYKTWCENNGKTPIIKLNGEVWNG